MLEASNISNSDTVLEQLGYKRPAWQADALCREYPHLGWFPVRGQSCEPALAVCGRCVVRPECLAWAQTDPSLDAAGILGGQSARARSSARRLAMKQTITTNDNEGARRAET